jgi:diadenylate cyclase
LTATGVFPEDSERMTSGLLHMVDIALGTVLLRVLLQLLVVYRNLVRVGFMLLLFGAAILSLNWLHLPFSGALAALLAVPVAVVLFMAFLPELGRIYQAATRGSLLRWRRPATPQTVAILAETVAEMARRKRGALIVLPRQDDPDPLVNGGEEVDAVLNKSLLLSLFDPQNPRHDGAVIIGNGRIIRLGAVLPLASADGADSDLGTRHLAAIGLTERCDADVLVVSEERGILSLAQKGELQSISYEGEEQLKEILRERLGAEDDAGARARAWRMALFLWSISFLLAALGSFTIDGIKEKVFADRREVLMPVSVPIVFTDIPPNHFVDELDTSTTQVFLLVGESAPINTNMSASVSLKGRQAGRNTINLGRDMITRLPPRAEIERIQPERVSFVLAEARSLEIKIDTPRCTGLATKLQVGQVTFSPSVLQAQVKDVQWKKGASLALQPINLSKVTAPGIYHFITPIDLPATIVPDDGSARVEVTVEVIKR